jgi:hypothetical protein
MEIIVLTQPPRTDLMLNPSQPTTTETLISERVVTLALFSSVGAAFYLLTTMLTFLH